MTVINVLIGCVYGGISFQLFLMSIMFIGFCRASAGTHGLYNMFDRYQRTNEMKGLARNDDSQIIQPKTVKINRFVRRSPDIDKDLIIGFYKNKESITRIYLIVLVLTLFNVVCICILFHKLNWYQKSFWRTRRVEVIPFVSCIVLQILAMGVIIILYKNYTTQETFDNQTLVFKLLPVVSLLLMNSLYIYLFHRLLKI